MTSVRRDADATSPPPPASIAHRPVRAAASVGLTPHHHIVAADGRRRCDVDFDAAVVGHRRQSSQPVADAQSATLDASRRVPHHSPPPFTGGGMTRPILRSHSHSRDPPTHPAVCVAPNGPSDVSCSTSSDDEGEEDDDDGRQSRQSQAPSPTSALISTPCPPLIRKVTMAPDVGHSAAAIASGWSVATSAATSSSTTMQRRCGHKRSASHGPLHRFFGGGNAASGGGQSNNLLCFANAAPSADASGPAAASSSSATSAASTSGGHRRTDSSVIDAIQHLLQVRGVPNSGSAAIAASHGSAWHPSAAAAATAFSFSAATRNAAAASSVCEVCEEARRRQAADKRLAEIFATLRKMHRERIEKQELREMQKQLEDLRDCGCVHFRPASIQHLANIKLFVFLLSVLVTVQQALSSGYLNSVITTIEKRYEIPSSVTGFIASMYEVGNLVSVIFVSYLGSRRNIPSWIGMGAVLMSIGSLVFALPHFLSDPYWVRAASNSTANICQLQYPPHQQPPSLATSNVVVVDDSLNGNSNSRSPISPSVVRIGQAATGGASVVPSPNAAEELLGQLPGLDHIKILTEGLESPTIGSQGNDYRREANCIEQANESSAMPIVVFMIAQLLLGVGGSPLFTLGTTYIDNHVKRDDSSMYIGCMYAMCAFGPVGGFLLGAYLLSHYVETFTADLNVLLVDSADSQWIGMWWGGFLVCGVALLGVSVPFFLFPKELKRDRIRRYIDEKYHHASYPSIRPLPKEPLSTSMSSPDGRRIAAGTSSSSSSSAAAAVGVGNVVSHTLSEPQGRATPGVPSPYHGRRPPIRHLADATKLGEDVVAPLNRTAKRQRPEPNAALAVVGSCGKKSDSLPPGVSSSSLSATSEQSVVTGETRSYGTAADGDCGPVRSTAAAHSSSVAAVNDSIKSDSNYGKDIKDIPRSTWKLMTNTIYMVTCFGACTELSIVSGFIIFLPKYLETQFNLSKSTASIFTGGVAIPGACIGIFAGGYLLKRLQLRPRGAVQLVLVANVICLACQALFFMFGCTNIQMVGTTAPYVSHKNRTVYGLELACNAACACDVAELEPVCGSDGLTYVSPCHAGCGGVGSLRALKTQPGRVVIDNYTDCACVVESLTTVDSEKRQGEAKREESVQSSSARSGACYPPDCQMIMPFLFVLFCTTLVVAVTQMPLFMVVLRSVDEAEKAFALGIQFVLFRLFGYIPSPILFGAVIDSTCLLWQQTCHAQSGGRCLLYDIELFRYKYVAVCCGLKVLSLLIFSCDWWLIRRRERSDKRKASAGLSRFGAAVDGAGGAASLHNLLLEQGASAADLRAVDQMFASIVSIDRLFDPTTTTTNESACESIVPPAGGPHRHNMLIDDKPRPPPPPTNPNLTTQNSAVKID